MTANAGPGVFNHLGFGAGIGTSGITIEAATPITNFVNLRAGVSWMPAITFNADADFTYTVMSETQTGTVNLKGDFGRVQGQVIFNVYPVPKVPVYVAAGAYFGGDKLLKITGHSADLANPDAQAVIGPSNAGLLCVKGRSGSFDFVNSPDLITSPLVKNRESGECEPVSWDDALALVAERFGAIKAEHGGESIAAFACSRSTNEDIYMLQKMARCAFDSPNVDNCARV